MFYQQNLRSISARFDKLAVRHMGFLSFFAAIIWLLWNVNRT